MEMKDINQIEQLGNVENISQKFFRKHPKIALAFVGFGLSSVILGGCGKEKVVYEIPSPIIQETPEPTPSVESTTTSEVVQEVELPEYLLFDANDNESLIEQSAQFIANSRVCGIDLSSAKDIRKYMDFYTVVNIDYIDPVDYARLNYNNKTTQSILDNYQYCLDREIAHDLYTVTPDTMLDYKFIADKASYEVLMQFQELIAKYNVEEDQKAKTELEKEIEAFLVEKFINEDSRGEYTHVTYEMIGIFASVADELFQKGLSKDVTEILCEDLATCGEKEPEGYKQRSLRAQAEIAIREALDDKLAIAREYRVQDLSIVSEMEKLTGYQVENEIAKRVAELDVEFVANPEMVFAKENAFTGTTTKSVTLSNGQIISRAELEGLGLNPDTATSEQYEQAVKNKFEQDAKNDPNRKLTNADGKVTGTGADAEYNAAEASQGASDAFNDGYNGSAFSPKRQTPSYLAGYSYDSYNQGVAARAELEANMNKGNSSQFESVENGPSQNVGESVTQEDYTDTPASPQPDNNSDSWFEPLPGGSVESSNETIIEEDYVETETYFEPIAANPLSELRALRAMIDTMIMNPTVTFDANGNAMFNLGGEEFELPGRSMKA